MSTSWSWRLGDIGVDITMHRWGEVGTPVLVFPPDGVPAAELERTGLVSSLGVLMSDHRAKIYAVDSIAGKVWQECGDPLHAAWVQNRFGEAVRDEIVPRIWQDCHTDGLEIVAAGAALGALEAVGAVCRFPDVFRSAIGLSGSYDLTGRLSGAWSDDSYFASPIHFLPGLEGDLLERLRMRFIVLATGTGAGENPGESWWLADVLGSKAIPNRVDNWPGYSRDWGTWQAMLPTYLHELLNPSS